MNFSQATINDSEKIADLHAKSWQHTYSEILDVNYLESQVFS